MILRNILFIILVAISLSIKATGTDSLKVETLQEVVVVGKNVIRNKNKETYLITDNMRKGAFTTLSVLQHIPGFVSAGIDNRLSYKGSTNILILKDGKEKDASYIVELAHIRFRKIEIVSHPTGRYRDYDYVINIVSKDNYEGIEGNIATATRVQPSTPYGDYVSNAAPSASLTYTRGKWDVATRYGFAHNKENRAHEMWRKEPNGDEIESVGATDDPTFMQTDNSHNWFIDTDYDISKSHSVSAKYSFIQTDGNIDTDYLMKRTSVGGLQTYHEQAWQTNNNTDHVFTAYYP